MLGKSLVAGTVLTLLAGGVVYYGTDVDGTISVNSDQETSEVMKSGDKSRAVSSSKDTGSYIVKTGTDVKTENEAESTSDIPSLNTGNGELIDPKAEKAVEVAEIAEVPEIPEIKDTSSEEVDASEETPTRKWIDQYLKSDPTPETDDLASETTDNDADAEAAAEIMAEDTSPSDAELEAEIAKVLAQDAEIAEVLAQEEAIEKELADMMADMSETEMLESLDVETDEAEVKKTEETELDLFTDAEILEAEAKGFEDRAKHIENIWETEDGSETGSKTLHKILKKHHAHEDKTEDSSATTENEVIDLGNSKITILRAENVEGHHASESPVTETDKRKVRIKVITDKDMDEDMSDTAKHGLEHGVLKIRKMKKSRRHSQHGKMGHDKYCKDESHSNDEIDVSETVKIIMAQAEKISMPELRDRAYLDLVSYALDNNDTTAANIAMSKIEQVELRDTARNRMAVDYAKNGNAEKAFAILENIEVDALRDVMRLQVIEALITPDAQSTQDMQ